MVNWRGVSSGTIGPSNFLKAHDLTQETLHFGSLYQWASPELMRWFDGGGVEPPKGMKAMRASGLLLAVLGLAALETWIEYTVRRGQPEVAPGTERAEFKFQPGAEPRSTR
jgi:hypothetical protein